MSIWAVWANTESLAVAGCQPRVGSALNDAPGAKPESKSGDWPALGSCRTERDTMGRPGVSHRGPRQRTVPVVRSYLSHLLNHANLLHTLLLGDSQALTDRSELLAKGVHLGRVNGGRRRRRRRWGRGWRCRSSRGHGEFGRGQLGLDVC